MGDTLDLKQMLFTNLQLLGFDAGAMEATQHVPFNKSMFDLPNKRGAEVVLHFLFNKLNPIMCREEFRDCWPVYDKQQEQQFRRTCHNWLVNVAKTEPDTHLPRIVASHFMSPGGDKFYNLLFRFSGYVLRTMLRTENGVKEYEYLRYPQLTDQAAQLGDVMAKNVQCAVVRLRKKFFEESQTTMILNREWKDYANELVKDYRKLSKEIREGEHLERVVKQRATEAGVARGSPMVRRRRSNSYDSEFDPQSTKRAQRVQQVRDMWKQVNDFCDREAAEREVIESIVDRTMSQHKIDAAAINIKIPDLLLRECEQEIRRRHVDNTFHGGKLNLVSLLQLWNLCLHLYIERLHQVGVADFTEEIGTVTSQVHTNHAYLTNTRTLKKEMSLNLPKLKETVEQLRESLDSRFFQNSTPRSARSTSLGIGLTEPSPTMSFTPEQGGVVPVESYLRRTPRVESSPEVVYTLPENVSETIRRGPGKLFQGSPEYVPRIDLSAKKIPASKVPRKVSRVPLKSKSAKSQDPPVQSTPNNSRTKSYTAVPQQTTQSVEENLNMSSQSMTSSCREQSLSSGDRTLTGITSCTAGSPALEHMSPRSPTTEVQRSHEPEVLSPSDIIVNRMMAANFLDQMDDNEFLPHGSPGLQILHNSRSQGSPRSQTSHHSRSQTSQHSTSYSSPKSPASLHSTSHESVRSQASQHSKSRDSLRSQILLQQRSHDSPRSETHSFLENMINSGSLQHSQNSSRSQGSPRSNSSLLGRTQESPRSIGSDHSSAKASVHSISSDLSRPSGLLDDQDQSPNMSVHSGHLDTSQLRSFTMDQFNKSAELDSSRHTLQNEYDSSFELEQPEFLPSFGSDNSGPGTPQDQLPSPRELSVMSRQELLPGDRAHSDHSIPISNGNKFKMDLGSPLAEKSDDSCPTSARALVKSLVEECDVMPAADQPEPEPDMSNEIGDPSMITSPLSKDVRDMWKEALLDTDSPKSRVLTSRSLASGFSPGKRKIDLLAGGDGPHLGFHQMSDSRGLDEENLEDIELPNISLDDLEEGVKGMFDNPVRFPQLDQIPGIASLDSALTGSLGDMVYSKPTFPLTNLAGEDSDILISLTPHKPVQDTALHLETSPWLSDMTTQKSGTFTDFDKDKFLIEELDLELVDDVNLDDSFVPLKQGFQLEGGTPRKSPAMSTSLNNVQHSNSLPVDIGDLTGSDSLMARMQELKQTRLNALDSPYE